MHQATDSAKQAEQIRNPPQSIAHRRKHSSLILEDIYRLTEGAKHPVHPNGVVAIVVAVSRVVNGMVASTHDRPYLAVNAVMDVCCPHGLQEYESDVRPEVCWENEECKHMWYCLQNPIYWMKRQPWKTTNL